MNWNIVAMYTNAYLQLTKQNQSFAIVCSRCHHVWDFGSTMSTQEIIDLATSYGYQLKKTGPVCDECLASAQTDKE